MTFFGIYDFNRKGVPTALRNRWGKRDNEFSLDYVNIQTDRKKQREKNCPCSAELKSIRDRGLELVMRGRSESPTFRKCPKQIYIEFNIIY